MVYVSRTEAHHLALDDEVLAAARAVAEAEGTTESAVVEAALRRYLAARVWQPVLDRNAGGTLTDDEAMAIAVEEQRAVRSTRRETT